MAQVPDGVTELLLVLNTAPFIEYITPKPKPSPFDAHEGSTALCDYIEREVAFGREVVAVTIVHHKQ